jgi:TPR repeat protein
MYKEAREDAEDAIDKSISYPPESRIKYYRLLSEALVGLNLLKEAYLVCQKGLELDSRDEVLMLRNRDLFSILESQPAEKFRMEDLKVKIANVETADSSEIEMLLKRYDILNPPDEDILELDFLEHFNNSAKMQEAIHWFHGIKGKQNNYERAFKIFEDLADKGNAEALYNLGECYGRGLGLLTYDYYKMLDCYRKAASKKPFIRLNYLNQSSLVPNFGVIQAEASLGDAFEKGKGVDVDLDKAFRHYLRAAQLGLAEAQHQLGVLLSEGKGVKQNHKFAREWFKKAADKGMAESMFNYAKMCELGHGGQIDNKDALDYYEKASREGTLH